MVENLQLKCENLMTFVSSNLYIHSTSDHETIRFSRLNIPGFLTQYIEDAVERLIGKEEEQSGDALIDNRVHLYVDPFKFCYLTWPMSLSDGHYTITLGPLINEHLTGEEIRYIGYKMKLSSDNCFILESFYGIVPYYDAMQMARISSMFLDYLPVDPHLPRIIREDHSIFLPEETKVIEHRFESYDFVEQNYAAEAKLLKAVEIGDISYVQKVIKSFENLVSLPPRFPSDPLREIKNLSITLNSICLRASLRGGLNQSIAHSLSHNFAIQIEQQTTTEGSAALRNKIISTYTESVMKYALKDHSETVVEAVSYIRVHLTEKVTLSDIADHLHISKEHLSRLFRNEMGMTVTDYIHQLKIKESCTLLTSARYSISQVALIFGYSSPAHYTKMFKKATGMSPRQWQKYSVQEGDGAY